MAQEWFYKFMGETVGPLSPSEFRDHAADRRVQPDTLVTRDGTDEWVSADRIKGLFDSGGALLPAPLPPAKKKPVNTTESVPVAPPVAPTPAQQAAIPQTPAHSPDATKVSSINPAGPSLIVIGVVLLGVSFAMNMKANDRDKDSYAFHQSVQNLHSALGTDGGSPYSVKADRTMAYVVGGFGGASILLGIVCLGLRTTREGQ